MGDIFKRSDNIPRKINAANKNYYAKDPPAYCDEHFSSFLLDCLKYSMSEGLLQAPPQSLHNVPFTFGGIDPRYIDKVCTAVGAGDEQSRGNVVGIVLHRDIFAPTSTILESVFALHGQPLSLSFDGYILPCFQKKVKRFFKFTKSSQLAEAPTRV
jgi:hypothetical protein